MQRILRHAKAHVTRDCYIKVFDRTVIGAMERLQAQVEELEELERDSHQMEFPFVDGLDQRIAVAGSQERRGFFGTAWRVALPSSGSKVKIRLAKVVRWYLSWSMGLGCAAKEQRSTARLL